MSTQPSISSGVCKGMKLKVPGGLATRPTLMRAREALMSILGGRIQDAKVLDLFAGSGALGLEMVSRGSSEVFLVDHDVGAIQALHDNVTEMLRRFEKQSLTLPLIRVVKSDVLKLMSGKSIPQVHEAYFDIMVADPPYQSTDKVLDDVLKIGASALKPESLLVIEYDSSDVGMAKKLELLSQSSIFKYRDSRKYGAVGFFVLESLGPNRGASHEAHKKHGEET